IERDHAVSTPDEVARQRRLHLLREQQARRQHGHLGSLSVDGVRKSLTAVAEVGHGDEDSGGLAGWPSSRGWKFTQVGTAARRILGSWEAVGSGRRRSSKGR